MTEQTGTHVDGRHVASGLRKWYGICYEEWRMFVEVEAARVREGYRDAYIHPAGGQTCLR